MEEKRNDNCDLNDLENAASKNDLRVESSEGIVAEKLKGEEHNESHHRSSHHKSSHHRSSHHESKSSRSSKKHSTYKKSKKRKEPSIKMLTLWLALLTVLVCGLLFWLIELNSRLNEVSDKLVDLASGNKTAGTEDSSVVQEDVERIPLYVRNEAEAVIERVSDLQNENTVSFIAISDMHMKADDTRVTEGLEHVGQAMALIREGVKIDFAASLGDMTWGAKDTPYSTGVEEIKKASELLDYGFAGVPNFRLIGNHDLLMYGYENDGKYLNPSELYDLIGKYNEGAVFPQGQKEKGYCYRDFADAKLRVICLNLNEHQDMSVSDTFWENYVTPDQVEWFARTLDLSAKENADEWSVIILSHQPLCWGEAYSEMVEVLDSYVSGASGKVVMEGKEIAFNFEGKNSAQVIANVHGHLHNFKTNLVGSSRIPTIAVPNACFYRNNEYGTSYSYSEEIHNRYGEKNTYAKTASSAEETAFCVVTMDFKYRRIYATCYGAGYDREISF